MDKMFHVIDFIPYEAYNMVQVEFSKTYVQSRLQNSFPISK